MTKPRYYLDTHMRNRGVDDRPQAFTGASIYDRFSGVLQPMAFCDDVRDAERIVEAVNKAV